MLPYTTVKAPYTTRFTEKHSEFISVLAPAGSVLAAADFIESIREKHRKASHVVYAYITREQGTEYAKFSDDGEPGGTAGKPVFEVLRAHNLTDCVLTVTRFFGGTLLGAPGLVRAYTKAAADAVNGAEKQIFTPCVAVTVTLPYTLYGRVVAALAVHTDIRQNEPVFTDNVTLEIDVISQNKADLLKQITELTNGQAEFVEYDEKYVDFA
jgi:uncharacterized YigZ family protein